MATNGRESSRIDVIYTAYTSILHCVLKIKDGTCMCAKFLANGHESLNPSTLEHLGIRGDLYHWLTSFLTERDQRVVMEGS